MKSGVINLEAFVQSYKESKIFDAYTKINRINDIKKSECDDLAIFSNELIKVSSTNPRKLYGFQLDISVGTGFVEQFDLLRFSETDILNIELKSKMIPLEEIQDQLIRHNYLLGCLPGNKNNILYTFISSQKKLYRLKDEKLIESNFEELFNSISEDYYEENDLLHLKSEDYIISPYSDIDRYLNTRYFLNSEQKKIVNEITSDASKGHVMIKGGAGTGKSLVLFDLANKLIDKGNTVLLIFCSPLSNYYEINRKVKFKFTDILNINFEKSDFLNYDYILLDESQRLWENKYNILLETQCTLIFAVDKLQTLKPEEKETNIENKLENKIVDGNKYNLKEKVRTDVSLSTFIRKFFDKSTAGLQPIAFPKVNAIYFDNKQEAKGFVSNLKEIENYTSIEIPQYTTVSTKTIKYKKIFPFSTDGFKVIGREYDNVLIPLDDRINYVFNKLSFYNGEYYPYLKEHGLFQAMTRVKKNLLFVVIGNVEMYNEIQKLINWENNKQHLQTSNRLKQLRKISKFEIDYIVTMCKISRETYEKLEETGDFPNNKILQKLSNFYNIKSDFLLGEPTQLSYTEFDILYQSKIKNKSKEERQIFNDKLIEFLRK